MPRVTSAARLTVLMVSLVASCGGQDNPVCEPGRVVTCPCLGGGDGVQTCDLNGSGYGACLCDAGTPDAPMDGGTIDAGTDAGRLEDATTPDSPATLDAGPPDGGPDCGDLDAVGTWTSLGSFDAVSGMTTALAPSLVLRADDTPFVAFNEAGDVYVATHASGAWTILAGLLSVYPGATLSEAASIAIDTTGRPVVSWSETNPDPAVRGASDIGVSHLDPDVWLPLGSPLSIYPGDSSTSAPSLAVGPTGDIHIAFAEREEDAIPSVVHVRQWNGTAWETVGTARDRFPATGGNPHLAFAPDGTLYICWWEQGPTISYAIVESWDGTTWTPIGLPVSRTPTAATGAPAFALSNDGVPHVIVDGLVPGEGTLELFRWTGTEWESLGSPDLGVSGATSASPSALAFDARDRPLVVLEGHGVDEQIVVRRYGSGTWSTLGGVVAMATPPDENVSYPRIAVTACGDPVVAWTQQSSRAGPADVHVARYER